MKKTTQIFCGGVLGLATILLPAKARAASDDDKKFLAMAAQSDQNEIALSETAEQKATNPAVKEFAEPCRCGSQLQTKAIASPLARLPGRWPLR